MMERLSGLQHIEDIKNAASAISDDLSPRWEGLFLDVVTEVSRLRGKMIELRAQAGTNSRNSSVPPSKDSRRTPRKKDDVVNEEPPADKEPKRRPGGRKGHKGRGRPLMDAERVDYFHDVRPDQCDGCGARLDESAETRGYSRRQQFDIPPANFEVHEWRMWSLICPFCGKRVKAAAPRESWSGYGPRLHALAALLRSQNRQSVRLIQLLLADLYGLKVSIGAINNMSERMTWAVEEPVMEVERAVENAAWVNMDETGHRENGKRYWLWVAVTQSFALFRVDPSRAGRVAEEMLGAGYQGGLSSDRAAAYNHIVPQWLRQICLAHLLRNLQWYVDRGVCGSKERAYELQRFLFELFSLWHEFQYRKIDRFELIERSQPARTRFVELLLETGEGGFPDAKFARFCRRLYKLKDALFSFIFEPGVEPTNNLAERVLRLAVIWRKVSFGARSPAGSLFVERMLTVIMTCRLRNRNPFEFLVRAARARQSGGEPPRLSVDARDQAA